MPLTKKGKAIKDALLKKHGEDGEKRFYALENSGKVKGMVKGKKKGKRCSK